jgi:hypothetical protein
MSAARVTFALIFGALASLAIGIGVAVVLSVEKGGSPPIPDCLPEPPEIQQPCADATVSGSVVRLAMSVGPLTSRKTKEPLAAPLPKPAEPVAPLAEPLPPIAPPAAKPADDNPLCYRVPCRRGLFRRR